MDRKLFDVNSRLTYLAHHGITFDEADTELVLVHHHWHILKDKKGNTKAVYAIVAGAFLLLHRYLMQPTSHEVIDHRDGNPLNNCRLNLRVTSQTNNQLNRGPKKGKKYKGVYLTPEGTYCARIGVDGIRYNLGTFATDLEAAKAYDAKAKILHGEYARLNCGS